MARVERIAPEAVRQKMQAGGSTLLVCAYETDEKFRQVALEGAIPLSELERRRATLAPDTELVFYCA